MDWIGTDALVVVAVLTAATTGFLRRRWAAVSIKGEPLYPPFRPTSLLGIVCFLVWLATVIFATSAGTVHEFGLVCFYFSGVFFAFTTGQNLIAFARN